MAFEGKPYLDDAKGQDDHADGLDKAEDKAGKVVDHREGIVCGQGGDAAHEA